MTPVTAATRPPRNGPMLRHLRPANSDGSVGAAAGVTPPTRRTAAAASQREMNVNVGMVCKPLGKMRIGRRTFRRRPIAAGCYGFGAAPRPAGGAAVHTGIGNAGDAAAIALMLFFVSIAL